MMGSVVKPGRRWGAVFAILCVAGCATTDRNQLETALAANRHPPGHSPADEGYVIACPDHVELRVSSRDDIRFVGPVEPDGRIDIDGVGRLRVEGQTPTGVRRQISTIVDVSYDAVSVRVTHHQSRYIFLTGSVMGSQQAVPYEGPESVVEFLQRAGGLKPGAALNQIHVVRSRVTDGGPPEVYDIDVEAVLLRGDRRSNLVLQPFDQVYVGQTKRSAIVPMLPPWLRPAFKAACVFCPNPNALRLRP